MSTSRAGPSSSTVAEIKEKARRLRILSMMSTTAAGSGHPTSCMSAAISRSNLSLCGSHCGISIGEDGPSQMGLEDIAIFRAVNGSVVLYPSDAVSAERLTEYMARTDGITYLRTSRPKTPILYSKDEKFPIPGFKVLRQSGQDRVTVIGAGITLNEALKAADDLKAKGTAVRVIDLYCVKPIDGKALAEQINASSGKLVVVEDHWADSGVGVQQVRQGGAQAWHPVVQEAPRLQRQGCPPCAR